jgi:PleD family two-component response regulator
VADKLRRLTRQSQVTVEGVSVRVTLSIGATLILPGDTADSVLSRADAWLYQVKREGRNRVGAG